MNKICFIVLADVHSESRSDERGTKTAWRSGDIQSSTSSVGRKKLIPVDFDLKVHKSIPSILFSMFNILDCKF